MPSLPTDIRRWPQRKRAIVLAGLTEPAFKALEDAEKLVSIRDFRGRRRYDPTCLSRERDKHAAEVFKAFRGRPANRPTGEICAAIFEAFQAGEDLRAIVIKHKTTPEYVAELRRQYAAMGGDLLVAAVELRELRELLGWEGSDGRSLVEAVYQRLRYQFQRGRELATEDTKHPTETEGKRPHAIDSRPEKEA